MEFLEMFELYNFDTLKKHCLEELSMLDFMEDFSKNMQIYSRLNAATQELLQAKLDKRGKEVREMLILYRLPDWLGPARGNSGQGAREGGAGQGGRGGGRGAGRRGRGGGGAQPPRPPHMGEQQYQEEVGLIGYASPPSGDENEMSVVASGLLAKLVQESPLNIYEKEVLQLDKDRSQVIKLMEKADSYKEPYVGLRERFRSTMGPYCWLPVDRAYLMAQRLAQLAEIDYNVQDEATFMGLDRWREDYLGDGIFRQMHTHRMPGQLCGPEKSAFFNSFFKFRQDMARCASQSEKRHLQEWGIERGSPRRSSATAVQQRQKQDESTLPEQQLLLSQHVLKQDQYHGYNSNVFPIQMPVSMASGLLAKLAPLFAHPMARGQFERIQKGQKDEEEARRADLGPIQFLSVSQSTKERTKTRESDPPVSAVRPLKKLANYAFDESDEFVKLYYAVPADISNLSADSIQAKFTDCSFDLRCTNHDGVDYEVRVQGLLHQVEPANCQVEPKGRDMLLVMLKKGKEGQTWGSLLKMDSKKAEKMPNMEEDANDPQAGLTKKMYDEGDDEMKRTIRKSFHESHNKQGGMGAAGMMGGMGGMASMMGIGDEH